MVQVTLDVEVMVAQADDGDKATDNHVFNFVDDEDTEE